MDRFNKAEIFMNIIIIVIVLITAFLFWPNSTKKTQSNEIDNTKVQIKILVKRVNIRKEATISSEDIGDVYTGEIYTVLEHVDKEDYYWYKITTNNNVTGYIASDPKDEYVEIISGVIDRTPPLITCNKDFLTFYNGEVSYDDLECIDDYSSCLLQYDNTDSRYIKFIAKDDSGNESTLSVKYYNVFVANDNYSEKSDKLDVFFTRTIENSFVTIKAEYNMKKSIDNEKKSINYTPIIMLFDENFNTLELIETKSWGNESEGCINNSNMSIKDEYINEPLKIGDKLCVNYYFDNKDSRVAYFALGFAGVENYDSDNNYLANYYSRYYIK